MIDKTRFEKENLKILGIMIRVVRNEYNYSLRKLSSLTNISHTLISNIEKGKQIPSEDTLSEILHVLNIELHTEDTISDEMSISYKKIYSQLINYQFEEARKELDLLEGKADIYENSYELINFFIIRTLYYTMTNTISKEVDINIEKYRKVLDFLSPEQQQIFYYIEGINYLNKDLHKQAANSFEKGLVIGNQEFIVYIQEQLVKAYFKQYLFTDSVTLARKVIAEYESRTNYVRAMNCRLTLSKLNTLILKFDKAEELIVYVENFAKQFDVTLLKDGCNDVRSMIHFLKNEYTEATTVLNKIQDRAKTDYYLNQTKVYIMEKNHLLENFFKVEVENIKHSISRLKYVLINVLVMWQFEEFRDDKKYLSFLKEFQTLSIESNDQEYIGLSHNLLLLFYKEKGKYKKALEVSENLLYYKKIHISYYQIKNK